MLFLKFLFLGIQLFQMTRASFKPRRYSKEVATCHSASITLGESPPLPVHIHYVDINPFEKKSMIMVHGWPGLWSTWSHQIEEFEADYRLLVPDLRGFGSSTQLNDFTAITMADLVNDLVCILESARITSTVCVGHDWGSQICYEAARMRPDIFMAVVGIAVPYIPAAADFIPISKFVPHFPRLAYQVYFEANTTAAARELDQDIRRTIRATFRSTESPPPDTFLTHQNSFLEGWNNIPHIPPVPFFTSDEEDYIVEQYSVRGFENKKHCISTDSRYNSWAFSSMQGNQTILQPVLSILPLNDPVADWTLVAKLLGSAEFLPRLTTKTVKGAHWVHIENSNESNFIIRMWLENVLGAQQRRRRTEEL